MRITCPETDYGARTTPEPKTGQGHVQGVVPADVCPESEPVLAGPELPIVLPPVGETKPPAVEPLLLVFVPAELLVVLPGPVAQLQGAAGVAPAEG